jgi:hypothetical protein
VADQTLPFVLVTFPPDAEVQALLDRRREDLQAFNLDGIPKSFVTQGYRAEPSLSVTADDVGRRVVKFGSTVLDGSMCLDPVTGEVIHIVGANSSRWFVNSTLAAFTTSIQEVSKAFPYYPDDATSADIEAAAHRVSEIIRKVDDQALVPDRYWATFIDDMRTGDWATGAVLDLVAGGY